MIADNRFKQAIPAFAAATRRYAAASFEKVSRTASLAFRAILLYNDFWDGRCLWFIGWRIRGGLVPFAVAVRLLGPGIVAGPADPVAVVVSEGPGAALPT